MTKIMEANFGHKKGTIKHEGLIVATVFLLILSVIFVSYNDGVGRLTGLAVRDSGRTSSIVEDREDRLSQGLKSRLSDVEDFINVIVVFEDYEKGLRQFAEDYDIEIKELELIDAIAVNVTKSDVYAITKENYVKKAYEDRIFYPTRVNSSLSLGAPKTWSRTIDNQGINGNGTIVAIIDTGIDYTHFEYGCTQIGEGCLISGGTNVVYDFVMADVTRQDIEDEFSDGDREPSVNIYANSSSTVYIRLPINSNVSAASFDINRWEYSTADNMTISIGNSSIFNASISAGTITIPVSNFSDVLNDYIETCMQSAGMCEIPLVFYSSSDSELFLDDLIVEYSYTTNEPVGDPMDIDGHGTHVAGIVHAVAPNAELYAYQVFTSGGVYESDVIKGITIAIRDKVDVISMSLGGGRYYGHCDEDPIVQAGQAALNEKISVVVATGNDGYSNSIASPSCGSGFISVGAINSNKEIASFSNGGSLLDVVSYGVGINSTVPLGIASSGYDAWDGTSMATPFVSGLVALYRQAYNLTYNETALAEHVSYIIGDTSDDLGVYGKDDVFGYGIPNITRMIDSLGYKTAISPEEQVIIFDAVEPGIHSKKLILTQQGIEQEFDILVNWTSLTNGNDEIMMMIDDEIDEFNESITDRLVLSIEANVIDDISAGRYNGEIKINVLQNDREIVIPVQLEVPLNVTSGNLFFQGNISEGETVKYPLNVSDSITAITVNITWVFETSDIDISLYSPGGDALIITSRDLKSEMDDDIRKSSDYERNVIFGKRR